MILKKFSKILLASALSCTILISNCGIVVQAQQNQGTQIEANVDGGKIVIGNDFIKREFSIVDGKVSTSIIENKRANTTLIPQEGSEDFVIKTLKVNTEEPIAPTEVLAREDWNATLTVNNGTAFPEAEVNKLFDGNPDTNVDNYRIAGYPVSLKIDLGEVKEVSSFSYLKRPGYSDPKYGKNGTMGRYALYVSEDGVNWTEAGTGEFTADNYNLHQEGNLHNVGDVVYGNFDQTYNTRYVRIDQLSDALSSTQEFTGAEINLFTDSYIIPGAGDDLDIKSSELVIDPEGTKIENIENGKKLTISYETYNLNGVDYDIDMVTVIEADDHYMRSFLEIKTNSDEARIDYIDMDNFVLDESLNDKVWSHPDLKDVSSQWIGKNELMLGQPIYANGMFFGSEFPAADTDIVNDEMQIRYYSGKSFEQLQRDNQLTTDGKFVSWQNVVGSAKGIETDVVQTDFFEYISEIATPTEFRKQYNSWYDNMLGITDESIAKSFYGSEKGLTKNGIEPVDSYVVDDGWNNYRDETFNPNISTSGSGEGYNRTGFWEFNSKFPNELYTSSELVSKFQSRFGVWLGPQGGYDYFNGFGKYLEQQGTGFKQNDYWENVCVGSDRYVKNLTELFVDYQERFDVDYWKIDGFAVRPCSSDTHDHMTGGPNNMYYTTDLWEKWTDAWDTMRANRAEEGKGLFINATCYINLSPWLLQWVNTIWVQDSGDTGHAGTGSRHQQKITYRDNVYHNLYKVNEIQFPLKNIYNHDPIYGVSDNSNATTEDFRDFLFANAVRGTAFWELYYSPSIMDDAKWRVNADALTFAEDNFHILEKAKLFGNRATEGVYGYSCWDGNEGILSFRNPTGQEQTYTLQLTDVVGVPRTVANLKGNQVLPFVVGDAGVVSYGDEVTVTLAPYETRIIQYGNTDAEAAEIVSAKVTGENEITIKYNERIENGEGVYSVEGNTISTELLEDYRTIVITTENKITDDVTLNINGERDALANELTTTLTIPLYENGEILSVESKNDLVNGENISEKYNGNLDKFFLEMDNAYEVKSGANFEGTTDFAISMAVKTTGTGMNLVTQGDEIALSIDEEGYINFRVKDLAVNSKTEVTTVIEKAHGTFGTDRYVPTTSTTNSIGKVNDGELHNVVAVREVNGMLKIYIDGELMSSIYDENLVNQNVQAANVVIGDQNFEGLIGGIELRNSTVYYDEAAEIYNSYKESNVIEHSRENWTVEACSEMHNATGDGPATSAIDGDEKTWWHTNYNGADNHGGNHWIAVDFTEETTFDTVNLLSRGKATNGSIKGYKLEANIDGQWQVVKEGELTDGVNDSIVLDESVTATGIRITSLSTFNGQNFAAIKEITVTKNDESATTEEIKAVSDLVQDIDENNYTAATANRYNFVAGKIKGVDAITHSRLDALKNELLSAYEGLLEAKELNALVAESEGLKAEDYTVESWEVFAAALESAKGTLNNIEATKADVDSAFKVLNDAKKALVEEEKPQVDKTELNTVIVEADKLLPSNYTAESWAVFAEALKAAKEVNNNEQATQEQVDTAKKNLEDAMNSLVEAEKDVFNKHLQIAVEEADKITDAELENVVPAVVTEFKAALEEAKAILANADATQAQIDASFDRLSKAMQMLSFEKGDKTQLQNLIDKINELKKSDFIPSTWKKLDDALKVANKVMADENAMAEEVKTTYDTLMRAFLELRLKPNKDKLNDLINKVEVLDKDKYTKDSWNKVNDALQVATAVFSNEEATADEVVKAEEALELALANLVEKGSDNSNKPNGGNTNNNGKPEGGKLPQTGGVPAGAVGLLGLVIGTAGAVIYKKKK